MNNKKFENEFRNAFLGNEQAPVDGFMYYEDKLGLERKPPLYKRRPFFVNVMMVCFFLIAIVATNLTTYFVKKDQKYYIDIEQNLLEYLHEEYGVISDEKILCTLIHNKVFELYLLKANESKLYYLIKYKELDNLNIELSINNFEYFLEFYNIALYNNDINSNYNTYYISESISNDLNNGSFVIKELENNNVLVKYCF